MLKQDYFEGYVKKDQINRGCVKCFRGNMHSMKIKI